MSYVWNRDGSVTVHQNDYVKDIVDKYKEEFGECRSFPMPGYPGKALLKAEGEPERLTEYRSFIRKLLFAMKKMYLELANPVHKLATHMDTLGPEHWKSIGQMIGYLKQEAVHGLIQYTEGYGYCRLCGQ